MTATPIPRTLQFSLLGARDLSVIQTPPPNRYPIQTEVHTFSEDILKEAIQFEMSRNGQVFVLNNRIQNIFELQGLIQRLVPDARVVVGHGQMEPEKLEQIIIDFANYEYDVLVATTIIESGIDIANANTIVVNNAQNFGLSDLHQLRGRVGRSNKKAFCYLFAPPLYMLSTESRRRLQAIENFSELGSGIHIAMQDLDIRGAGNMLGAEQSGFIADLGYETYQKILQEAVTELKNEEFSELYRDVEMQTMATEIGEHSFVAETVIESDMELLLPNEYIPSDSERISLYRELDNMEQESDITAFVARLEDRFGRIPSQARELIRIVRLRRLAKRLGFEKLSLKNERMFVYFVSNDDSPYYQSEVFGKVIAYLSQNPRTCQLRETKGKRSMVLQHVATVETAIHLLERMLE
jgi:transcription-repair coupling factor (superfamily II helicase)